MSETLKLVITADTKEAIENIQQFAKGMDGVKTKLGSLANVQGQSTQALTNFNRVVQDAPYGIQGIANNIDPLVQSFQGLQKSTGSVTGAIGAMASSLIGPAGIAIAISAITTIAIKFGDDIVKYFSNARESVEELKKSMSELNKELFAMAGKGQADLFKGQVLGQIAAGGKDITQRKNALEDLKELYKSNAEVQKLTIDSDKAYIQSVVNKAAMQDFDVKKQGAYNDELGKLMEDRKIIIAEGNKKLSEVTKTIYPVFGAPQTIKMQKDAINAETNAILKTKDAQIAAVKAKNKELIEATTSGVRVEKTTKSPIVNQAQEDNKAITEENKKLKKELLDLKTFRDKMKRIGTDIYSDTGAEKDRKFRFEQEKKRITGKDTQTSMGAFLEKDADKKMAQYTGEATLMEAKLSQVNKEMQLATDITAILAPQFDAVFAAMLNGEDIGDALAESFKQIVIQIASMIAKMLIFKAVMAAITGGTEEIATTAAENIGDNMAKGSGGGFFKIMGKDLVLATTRTQQSNKLKQ